MSYQENVKLLLRIVPQDNMLIVKIIYVWMFAQVVQLQKHLGGKIQREHVI